MFSAMTVPDVFERAYVPCRLVAASERTLVHYRLAMKHWARVHPGLAVSLVDMLAVAMFQRELAVGRTAAAVNAYTRPLKAILRFAAESEVGLLDVVPPIRMLPERRRPPLALTVEEFSAVLRRAQQVNGMPAGWWRAVLLTAWETGLRFTALMDLRTVDVLWEDGGLFSRPDTAKDRDADWFPLQPATLAAIRAVFDLQAAHLFPRSLALSTIGKHFRAILDQSGIYAPQGSGMAFHRLRRSKASYTELAGGDPQRALGHSARSVTERYLDPRIVGRAKQPPMPIPS